MSFAISRLIIFIELLFLSSVVYANNSNVRTWPNHCKPFIDKACLIKTISVYEIKEPKIAEVKVFKNSLINVSLDEVEKKIHIEVLKGQIILNGSHFIKDKTLFVNGIETAWSQSLYVKRSQEEILIFNESQFVLQKWILSGRQLQQTQFLNKVELVQFLINFYPEKDLLLNHLKKIEISWQSEFKKQLQTQTQALRRAVASEEKERLSKQQVEQTKNDEIKKVREQFFYRTFYR